MKRIGSLLTAGALALSLVTLPGRAGGGAPPRGGAAARSHTLSTPVIPRTKAEGVKSPSTAASASAE